MLRLSGRACFECNTEAGRRIDLIAIDVDRCRETSLDALGDAGRVRSVCDSVNQERELVRAQASCGITGPRAVEQTLGDGYQEDVPGGVPQALVDGAEVVQVEQNDSKGRCLSPVASNGLRQTLHEQDAVGEASERIVEPFSATTLDSSLAKAQPPAHGEGWCGRRGMFREGANFLWRPRSRRVCKHA
jgi:hypothetical protein